MPWKVGDVEEHRKGLTKEQKETWVKIANSALETCRKKEDTDPDECEGYAIRVANAHFAKEEAVTFEMAAITVGEETTSEDMDRAAVPEAQRNKEFLRVSALMCHGGLPGNTNRLAFKQEDLESSLGEGIFTPARPGIFDDGHALHPYGVWYDAAGFDDGGRFAVRVEGVIWAWRYPDFAAKVRDEFERGSLSFSMMCRPDAGYECSECGAKFFPAQRDEAFAHAHNDHADAYLFALSPVFYANSRVSQPADEDARGLEVAEMDEEKFNALTFTEKLELYYADKAEEAEKWKKSFVNSLPDSSFAVVEGDYKSGKTENKACRHLPFKDKDGKVDVAHLRNALARVNQIQPVSGPESAEELQKKALNTLNKYRKNLETEKAMAYAGRLRLMLEEKLREREWSDQFWNMFWMGSDLLHEIEQDEELTDTEKRSISIEILADLIGELKTLLDQRYPEMKGGNDMDEKDTKINELQALIAQFEEKIAVYEGEEKNKLIAERDEAITALQAEKAALEAQIQALTEERDALIAERDELSGKVKANEEAEAQRRTTVRMGDLDALSLNFSEEDRAKWHAQAETADEETWGLILSALKAAAKVSQTDPKVVASKEHGDLPPGPTDAASAIEKLKQAHKKAYTA